VKLIVNTQYQKSCFFKERFSNLPQYGSPSNVIEPG